jgi:hypothetical protein
MDVKKMKLMNKKPMLHLILFGKRGFTALLVSQPAKRRSPPSQGRLCPDTCSPYNMQGNTGGRHIGWK